MQKVWTVKVNCGIWLFNEIRIIYSTNAINSFIVGGIHEKVKAKAPAFKRFKVKNCKANWIWKMSQWWHSNREVALNMSKSVCRFEYVTDPNAREIVLFKRDKYHIGKLKSEMLLEETLWWITIYWSETTRDFVDIGQIWQAFLLFWWKTCSSKRMYDYELYVFYAQCEKKPKSCIWSHVNPCLVNAT